GLTTLVFALAPRLTAGVGYGLIGVSFLWELFGPALKVPAWMLDLSPFHHVAAVPIYPFNIEAAIVMALLGLTAVGASLLLFRRRDLIQA
ncbi:MAG TPA: hypothetical protein VKU87_05235, partial [Thermomicrobiaceae bacterium]|nr:hypothetical protein [Thermomicrobiaceae bacterium]